MNIFNCRNLIAMGRHIPTPFHVAIAADGGEVLLKISSVLRVVPGKRLVALCNWDNQIVVIKLFFRRGNWKQSMLRDLKGITLLRQAGIPTPKVLNQTTTSDKHGAVLLISYLKDATSLLTLFDDANSSEEKNAIMEMGVGNIARRHQAGLWQSDIHLGNFMLSRGKIFVLDGGDIQGDGRPLTSAVCLQNLAVFFAQFPAAMDVQIPHLLNHYQQSAETLHNAGTESIPLIQQLQSRVVAARQRRVRSYERKIFRSTTAHRQVHTSNRFAMYDRSIHSEAVENFIQDPDSLMRNALMLKKGNSSTVARVRIDDRDFVLKRYNVKGFLHGLKRLLQKSRAHNSWRNAAMLEMLGVATPHACLMVEERLLWLLRRRAWYLSEYIGGNNLLQQLEKDQAAAANNSVNENRKLPMKSIVERFNDFFRTMLTYNISHGDMKASNFIFKNNTLYVLDLDAMRHHRNADAARPMQAKDRERFRRNFTGTDFESALQKLPGDPVSP